MGKKKKQGIWRLLEIAKQEKGKLIISSMLSVFSSALSLAPFIIIYLISFELFSPAINKEYIWSLVWFGVIAVIFRLVSLYFSVVFSHIAAYDILYRLRRQLAKHLGTLPMGYFSNQGTGGLKKILNDDVEEIELFIAHHIPDIVSAIVLPLMTIGYLFFVDWRLALAALIPIPLAFLAQRAALSDAGDLTMKYHKIMETMNSTIIDYVRGMPVIKVFNQTIQSFTRFKKSVTDFKDLCIMWTRKSLPPHAIFTVLVTSTLFTILPFGVWFFLTGKLHISVLILFLLLGVGYSTPLLRISMYSGIIGQIVAGVDRIDSVLGQSSLPGPDTPKSPENYDIEFRDVSFSYEENNVLNQVNFKANEGCITALVGPSGAGKSTIAQLIPRFWDVQAGEILIGGVNIKQIPIEELMKITSFVFQEVFMFNDTIYENIRMGKQEAAEEEIINAAKAAQAHQFIMDLPEGYHTVIGAGGTHLSGGEKQRISVARAILKDTPIIVLDEATTFTDIENEVKMQNAISNLLKNKTVIIIAHRLSTIRRADQILLINKGKIIERGKHEALVKNDGLYKKMWDAHISAKEWELEIKGD